ncbi:hypothetical protein [Actinopolymorpha rutila]|uniref:Integral membrane protein n=1 Tax=Actinopolymorpha rutila TaxID=446787 RepID=A0A852ZDL1_9ACTN|nr:hypothetical protein [Actinopolymorpha rutila]NYH89908.1 hypothetical protein [Actinopolymorpha rutila]
MSEPRVPRDDAEAALHARKELGPDFEPAVVDSFVERIDAAIEARVAQEVSRARKSAPAARRDDGHALALAIVSMGVAIPVSGLAAHEAGLGGLIVAWIGIVMVNLAYALGRLRRDD